MNDKLKSMADLWRSTIKNNTDSATNKAVFPVGSLELKVSWIKSSALPASDTLNYYRTMAFIDGSVQEVALLGMHVVGVVKNHPEFIWATFEHHDLAPVYKWKKSTTVKDAPVTSATNRLFFASGTQGAASDLTYNPKVPAHAQNVFSVYPFGVPMMADSVYMKASQSEPLNYSNIQEINGCVSRHLKDVWNNYFYNGSIWVNTDGLSTEKQIELLVTKGGGLGNSDSTGVTRGSVAAFNITMETYVQLGTSSMHAQKVGSLTNCISCHSAQAKIIISGDTLKNQRSPLYLSHIFRSSLSLDAGVSKPAIKALRRSEFVELLKK